MMSNNLIYVSIQGQYKFVLKVTDADGKSDEDVVKVYVKPPTNLPPVAVAGPGKELSLPLPSSPGSLARVRLTLPPVLREEEDFSFPLLVNM